MQRSGHQNLGIKRLFLRKAYNNVTIYTHPHKQTVTLKHKVTVQPWVSLNAYKSASNPAPRLPSCPFRLLQYRVELHRDILIMAYLKTVYILVEVQKLSLLSNNRLYF